MAVQSSKRALSALSKSTALRRLQMAYWRDFVYNRRTDLPHVLMSRSKDLSPRSQRQSLHRMKCPVTAEEKVGEAAGERSAARDHAMPLLTYSSSTLFTLFFAVAACAPFDDERLLEWDAVKKLQFTAIDLSLLLSSLS